MAQDIYVINKELSSMRISRASLHLDTAQMLLKQIGEDPDYRDETGAKSDLYPDRIVTEISQLRKRIQRLSAQLDDYGRILNSGPAALEQIDAGTRGDLTTWWERFSREREGLGQYFLKSCNPAALVGIGDFRSNFHRVNVGLKALGVDTASIGGSLLDMREDQYGDGIYHADIDCWQRPFGYTNLYDMVFGCATSMDKRKYEFVCDGTEYIFWCWKGDYLNLGAGAELGIYYGGGPLWKADRSLSMDMSMELRYTDGRKILSHRDTTWWITGFNSNPEHLNVDDRNLRVTFEVQFPVAPEDKQKDIYTAFMMKCLDNYPEWKFNFISRSATLTF